MNALNSTRAPDVLRIPAQVSQLASVRQFIRDHAHRAGADQATTTDLVQAVDESVTNAIVHGYRGSAGSVEVAVSTAGDALVVRLRDEAPVFDPTSVATPDVTRPLEQQRLGGLGILLMRELTDSMSYRQLGAGVGNELTLSKTVTPRGESDAQHHRRA